MAQEETGTPDRITEILAKAWIVCDPNRGCSDPDAPDPGLGMRTANNYVGKPRWYFQWEPERSMTWNIYKFHGCLSLYGGSCRRWEEMHNGHVCVVERVRDKYLMPKIKEFERMLRSRLAE